MKTLKICVTVLHALFVCRSLFANELCKVTALRFSPPLSDTFVCFQSSALPNSLRFTTS